MPEFTATQTRLMGILSDGNRHSKEELHACLPDDLGGANNLQKHVSDIRKKLRPIGQDILCELNGRGYYRLVRYLAGTSE